MEEYTKMLDRLYLSLPKEALSKERFEPPKIDALVQGNKTIFRNFGQIAKILNRPEKQMYKFFTKETGVSAVLEDGKMIFSGKFYTTQLEKIFGNYLEQYVLCHECKKPDTKIVDQQGIKMLKCEACGAFTPLKKL